jgi:hypothetical protein
MRRVKTRFIYLCKQKLNVMANMSYCRFQNTYNDLIDCYNNIDSHLSDQEHQFRLQLVELCQSIVDEFNPSCQNEDDNDEE